MSARGDQIASAAAIAGTDMLADMCIQGLYATGAQLAVSVDGCATVSTAVGSQVGDRPLEDDHLFNVWCASKPVPALIVMKLLEELGLPLTTSTAEIKPGSANVVGVPVGSVLNHSCGLRHPELVTANLMPYEDVLSQARRQQGNPNVPAFSEFTAGVIIADLIESLSGHDIENVVDDFLNTHELVDDFTFGISDEVLENPLDHLGFYITGLPVLARPLYSDAVAGIAQHNRHIMGAYANARGLCELYRLVGLVLRGTPLAGFPTPSYLSVALDRHGRARDYDETLNKTCSFAAGFMTNLADHGYGTAVSPEAIGHTGLVGSPFGFYDPHRKLAVAAVVNGMTADPHDADRWRSDLITTICQAVDEAADPVRWNST